MENPLASQQDSSAADTCSSDSDGPAPATGRLRLYTYVLVVSSLAVGLVIGEAAVRLFLDHSYHMWPPGLRQVFTPLPTVMPGITGPSQYVINQDGLRGDPLPHDDTYKILAIGGSTTECVYLDETETWPYLLQQSLASTNKVWVGNAGRSGLNTKSHILQLTHLTGQYRGIDAVIMLIGVNDFMQRLAKGNGYQPFLGVDALSPSDYEMFMSQTFFTWPGADNREPFFKRMALYRVTRELQYRYLTVTPKRLMQDIDGSVYDVWRANRRQASAILHRLPDLSSALKEYRQNIKTLAEVAAQRGLRLVLVTQPYLWHTGLTEREQALLWLGGVGRYQEEPGHEYYAIDALADGMDRYNHLLLALCRTEGLECIDLDKEMPKNTSMFFDDVHFTEAGARHVAQVVSRYLASRLPFWRAT
jgi:lysophospholipase L1-like esterase